MTPALIEAPLRFPMVTVPLSTDSCVVARLPSTSLTLMPPMARLTSSVAVCVPGTVLTGRSLTATMLKVSVEVSVPPAPSLTVYVITGIAPV